MRALLLVLIYCLPSLAFATKRLAVLEFRGVGVGDTVLMILSDAVRTGVLDVTQGKEVDGDELVVMTRENMMDMLNQMGKTAEDCQGSVRLSLLGTLVLTLSSLVRLPNWETFMSLRLSSMGDRQRFCLLHRFFKRVTSNLIRGSECCPDQQEGAECWRNTPRKHQRGRGSKWSNTGRLKWLVCR